MQRIPPGCTPEQAWAPGIDAGQRRHGVAQVAGSPPWDRAIRVPGLVSIAGATTGQPVTYDWTFPGTVVGIRAGALGVDTADLVAGGLSCLGLKLEVGGGNQQVFGNGQTGDFIPVGMLLSPEFPANFQRTVQRSEAWTITFKNYSAAQAYTPELVFHFQSPPFYTADGQIVQNNFDPLNRPDGCG